MSWQLRRDIVTQMMRTFTFTYPVTAEDTSYVAQALRAALPGCACTVIQVHARFVHVSITDAQGLPVYGQDHVVIDQKVNA